jgi:diguanylate cyclase (GGDEF)-like protein
LPPLRYPSDNKKNGGFSGAFGQMSLDVNTLFLVTIYVEAILGLLLLFAWVQNPSIRAVAWWGSAHLLRAGSIALFGLYGTAPDFVSIDIANALLITAFAVTWMGARVFDGRRVRLPALFAGAAGWTVIGQLMPYSQMADAGVLASSGIIATYTWLTAYEFWRGRSEPLVSRWPAIFMLFAHGSLYLLRTPVSAMLTGMPASEVFGSVWLTVLSFEGLLFTISIAFILLAMAKERTEFRHRTAAMVDPLTGVANRRAFLQASDDMMRQQGSEERSVSVILFDLDHFKSVNDRFGHALGDRVLQIFADTVSINLRPTDIFGRLGGEEFAACLRNVGPEYTVALAERIRADFEKAAAFVAGTTVGGTVSIGVVVSQQAPFDLHTLLGRADQALYAAKERGRNRVELAGDEALLRQTVDMVDGVRLFAEKTAVA